MWYIQGKGSRQEGPYPAGRIPSLIARGAIHTGTLVWSEGMPEWAPAGRVLEFSPLFESSSVLRHSGSIPPFLSLGEGVLFGFSLDFLPDFLADHTLLGRDQESRLREHCRRWVQLLGGLWIPGNNVTVFVLHAQVFPEKRKIDLHILCFSPQAEFSRQANDLQRALVSFGMRPRALSSDQLDTLAGRTWAHFSEIHQFEQSVPIDTSPEFGKHGYNVLPWWGPGGPFLAPFQALLSQHGPVAMVVRLKPTALTEAEKERFAKIAVVGRTGAATTVQSTLDGQIQRHAADPQAEWSGRLFAANLRRLTHPFLACANVLADEAMPAKGCALALAATIGEEAPFDLPLGESVTLQSRAGLTMATGVFTLADLLPFTLTGSSLTNHQDEQRLRYLTDARGAGSVFRLPVSIFAGVPGISVRQQPPDFHPGPRSADADEKTVQLGTFHSGGQALIPLHDFTKHVLVTGFTGSGKTKTILHLLDQIWNDEGIPFLILELAKKEYRQLLAVKDWRQENFAGEPAPLRVYTPGDESCAPFRFNPFELLPGVHLETHLGRLQTCFEAALPQIGPLPSILVESLERVYRHNGWLLTDQGPREGKLGGLAFPTMAEFAAMAERVIEERKYSGEVRDNVRAAVAGRIKPLLMGSRGRMFGTRKSCPGIDLLKAPTILELNDLNESDKALFSMLLLTFLREYREQNPAPKNSLVHLTVVEEAHNVLENVVSKGPSEIGNDLRGKAVQAFCTMLAEVRAYGEGIIIADQSPEKLAPDAIRNTNLQIAHQLRDGNDRKAMANAMIMTPEQQDFLGKLIPGQAAVFFTGLERATFVTVPHYGRSGMGVGFDEVPIAPAAVQGYMRKWTSAIFDQERAFGPACLHCPRPCDYRLGIFPLAQKGMHLGEFVKNYQTYIDSAADLFPLSKDEFFRRLVEITARVAAEAGFPGDPEAGWCALLHLWNRGARTDPKALRKPFLARFSSGEGSAGKLRS